MKIKYHKIKSLLLFTLAIVNYHYVKAIDPKEIPLLAVGAGGIAYYTQPLFANAVYIEDRNWMVSNSGNRVYSKYFNWAPGQVNVNGYPQYLLPNQTFFVQPGQNMNYGAPLNAVIQRNKPFEGLVCLTWEGDADIRIVSAGSGFGFVSSLSGGNPSTGRIVNGKRYYRSGTNPNGYTIEIVSINSVTGLSKVRAWMPDPTDPNNKTLEPAVGQPEPIFHPTYLKVIEPFKDIRFMDWAATNASPVQDWADRRLPTHSFMEGVINRRGPTPGYFYNASWSKNITVSGILGPVVTVTDIGSQLNQTVTGYFLTPSTGGETVFARTLNSTTTISGGLIQANISNFLETNAGDKGTGVPYEYMVALGNLQNKNIWINIPHLATNDFIIKMAQLIKFGSDGVNPYTSPQANPVYPPLNPNLKVYVEYSNEIWSNTGPFCQGDWAEKEGTKMGLGTGTTAKARFNARRCAEIFDMFRDVFGSNEQLINVAAAFTGNPSYTEPYMSELTTFGQNFSPVVKPDVFAVTTYFSCRIEQWANDQGPAYYNDLSEANVNRTIDEFKRRMLSFQFGAGSFDANDIGGFGIRNRDIAKRYNLPVVAYEGGPSIYTDKLDSPGQNKENLTNLMCLMNRHSRFADIYNIHLNQARSIGLRMHSAFVDVSGWGKYGQWGHMEAIHQEISTATGTAVKMKFLFDFQDENRNINHIYDSTGTRPKFVTNEQLTLAKENQPYDIVLSITGGDGIISKKVISAIEAPGVTFDPNTLRFRGTPTQAGLYYYFVRIVDSDGDPDYRTFTLRVLPKVQNALYVWEDFGTQARDMSNANTGMVKTINGMLSVSGFRLPWEVQGGANNFMISVTSPLSYPNLSTSGVAYGVGGSASRTAYRQFRISDFDYLISAKNSNVIGQPQTQMWISAVINRDPSSSNGFILASGTQTIGYVNDEHNFRIRVLDNGLWGLEVRDSNAKVYTITTCTGPSANSMIAQNVLLLVAVKFGVSNDTLEMYVNPVCLGGIKEPTPNARFITSGQRKMEFTTISYFGNNGSGSFSGSNTLLGTNTFVGTAASRVRIDDIRIGDSYKAVTPSLDNSAPNAPANLTLSGFSFTTANISWNAASDNVGVAGYDIYDGNNLVRSSLSTVTSITLTGLIPGQTYILSVKARDCADNLSVASNTVTVNTNMDSAPPSDPGTLSVVAVEGTSATLSWLAATDNVAVSNYVIYQNGNPVVTTSGLSFLVGGLNQTSTYNFFVKAVDAAGNYSTGSSNTVTVTTKDITAPSQPTHLAGNTVPGFLFHLSWSPSTDNVGVAAYNVFLNNNSLGTTVGTTFTVLGLTQGINNQIRVRSIDVNGNNSLFSTALGVYLPIIDLVPPTLTGVLSVSAIKSKSAVLSWPMGTDNIEVIGYRVKLNTNVVATVGMRVYTLTGLSPLTNYTAAVVALDGGGNESQAISVNFTTIDNTAPSIPQGMQLVTVGGSFAKISWNASTDDVGVSGYKIWKDGGAVATTTSTNFTLKGLESLGVYTVTTSAFDASGNESGASAALIINTLDTIAPDAPQNLKVIARTSSSIKIGWDATTIMGSVSAYEVYKDSVLVEEVNSEEHISFNLTIGNVYSFYVVAKDQAGNKSQPSAVLQSMVADQIKPTLTGTLLATYVNDTTVQLSWQAATDNGPIKHYVIYSGFDTLAVVTSTSVIISSLTPTTTYNFLVKAVDLADNQSGFISIEYRPMKEKVILSGEIAVLQLSDNTLSLSWTAAVGNLKHYEVYNEKTLISTLTGTKTTVAGITANTLYKFKLVALSVDMVASDTLYKEYTATALATSGFDKNNVSLFPNPATNLLFLENTTASSVYKVYDVQGLVVISGATLERQTLIDINSLSQGMYMVVVQSGDRVQKMNFIKQ